MATLDITESKTLLEFLLDLLNDKDALADFRDHPHEALHAAGLGDCTVDDIKELLPVVLEKVDAEKCAQYEDDCDDDKCWDSEPKHDDHHEHHHKPVDCDDEGRPAPHCSPTDQVVAHLNYVTNNYSYDSHDTYNTTNNITKIWAGDDADIRVDNTTTNVGDHGSFVGGDNNAPIVTGDHSFVGDGNQVSGDGSTTAFGAGSALSHVGTGDGGVISTGSGTVNNSNAFGDGNQVAGANGVNTDSHADNSSHVDASTTDSGNTDNSHQDNHNEANTDSSIHDNDTKLASDNDLSHTDHATDGGTINHDSIPLI